MLQRQGENLTREKGKKNVILDGAVTTCGNLQNGTNFSRKTLEHAGPTKK